MHLTAQVGRLNQEVLGWKSDPLRGQVCGGFVIAHCVNAHVHVCDEKLDQSKVDDICLGS